MLEELGSEGGGNVLGAVRVIICGLLNAFYLLDRPRNKAVFFWYIVRMYLLLKNINAYDVGESGV